MERKSLRLWRKIKLLVKVKLGLPTNKTRNKEDLIVDKDISSLEHTRWRCQYHVVFARAGNQELVHDGEFFKSAACAYDLIYDWDGWTPFRRSVSMSAFQ